MTQETRRWKDNGASEPSDDPRPRAKGRGDGRLLTEMEVDATTFNRITAALPRALGFTGGLAVRRGDQCSPWQESSADQGLVR